MTKECSIPFTSLSWCSLVTVSFMQPIVFNLSCCLVCGNGVVWCCGGGSLAIQDLSLMMSFVLHAVFIIVIVIVYIVP